MRSVSLRPRVGDLRNETGESGTRETAEGKENAGSNVAGIMSRFWVAVNLGVFGAAG